MTTHLLLDIEGTTCPVSFVTQVLFPYAATNIRSFIESHYHDNQIKEILKMAHREWKEEPQQQANSNSDEIANQAVGEVSSNQERLINYLTHLIAIDRKSKALKDLEGKIWEEGYKKGLIHSTLFEDAHESLPRWHQNGITLAVYSSGSIQAQKLLYENTERGNLCGLFSHWFDTHSGAKKCLKSYQLIAKTMRAETKNITFISDNGDECDAAENAGMQTLFSLRKDNPDQNPRHHRVINNLNEVDSYLLATSP
jgi:enolase-phosphatase E1